MGNDIGNGLVSCGCLIMLVPVLVVLIVILVAFVSALLGGG